MCKTLFVFHYNAVQVAFTGHSMVNPTKAYKKITEIFNIVRLFIFVEKKNWSLELMLCLFTFFCLV